MFLPKLSIRCTVNWGNSAALTPPAERQSNAQATLDKTIGIRRIILILLACGGSVNFAPTVAVVPLGQIPKVILSLGSLAQATNKPTVGRGSSRVFSGLLPW